MEEKRSAADAFESFRQVVEKLRSGEGCPWDRAQTMKSLKPCMVNEMTETLAGIDLYEQTGDAANLCEELGDVLLLVMLQAQIAQEKGLFDIADVIEGVRSKMVRRHPHVFPEEAQPGAPTDWQSIKREEKKSRMPAQEAAERKAFQEAAGWTIRHLQS